MSAETAPAPESRIRFPGPVKLRWLVFAIFVLVLLVIFPPFRIVRLNDNPNTTATSGTEGASFDAAAFALSFWNERLLPETANASGLVAVLEALRASPSDAADQLGLRAGLGGPASFFVRGEGTVVSTGRSSLILAVSGADDETVSLRTGPVFGSVVRDGTGLLEVNLVPGLAEFNAISAELNRMVEDLVQPKLQNLEAGTTIRFAGCAKSPASLGDGPALEIVPVMVEVHP